MTQDNLRHAQYGATGTQIDDPQSIFPSTTVDTSRSLFSGQGLVAKFIPRVSVASSSVVPQGIIAQFSDKSYLAYDGWPGVLEGSARLTKITGNPLKSFSASPLTQTSALATNALKNTAGVVVGSSSNSITQAWTTTNGDVFFVMVATGNFHFLYRAKATTYTVGSDAGYSNKQALIDIGLNGGVQADNIRTFNQRALLEAKVGNATHLFFCEYNVSAGRVAGSGGAGKDQVIAYRSTDGGTTWSVFFEFNTAGAHVLDHFHGAVQDPYTGWIYFLTGDSGAECAIIGYNGTAAAVAANASLATIGSTAGYKVINGSELNRYTDLAFDQLGLFSVPDCDTEAADTGSVGFVATRIPRMLEYVASIAAVERFPDIPPCQILQSVKFGTLMISFRTESAATTSEPYIWMWSANVEEGTWDLVAKFKNFRAATGVPKSFFIDSEDILWIAGSYKGGLIFNSAETNLATTSSVAISLKERVPGEVYINF